MKYIKTYESHNTNIETEQTIKLALADLSDSGYEVKTWDMIDTIIAEITKPIIVKEKAVNGGFRVKDIKPSLDEMLSHLTAEGMIIKVIHYHIKGFEQSTWYTCKSMDKLAKDIQKNADYYGDDIIDGLSVEFMKKK